MCGALVFLQVLHFSLVISTNPEFEDQEDHNCTGYIQINDRDNKKHSFRENVTELSIEAVKDDIVTIEGDCCFELFSESHGRGSAQLIQSSGQFRLELEDVSSMYKVDCARRGMHPLLKFFLIAVGIIIGLFILYSSGKQALFRKRFWQNISNKKIFVLLPKHNMRLIEIVLNHINVCNNIAIKGSSNDNFSHWWRRGCYVKIHFS